MSQFVSLCDAKTHLSALVERAAAGEEIVIAKNGVPLPGLLALPSQKVDRVPANAMGLEWIAADFGEADPGIEAMFDGADA